MFILLVDIESPNSFIVNDSTIPSNNLLFLKSPDKDNKTLKSLNDLKSSPSPNICSKFPYNSY